MNLIIIIILVIIISINCIINAKQLVSIWSDEFNKPNVSKSEWIIANNGYNCHGKLHCSNLLC